MQLENNDKKDSVDDRVTTVTIIGGGLSGIMAATKITHEFLEKHPKGSHHKLDITIYDPQEKLGGNTYNRYDVNVYMAQPIKELGFDDAMSFVKHMNRVPKSGIRTPTDWKRIAPQVPYDESMDGKTGRPKGFDPEAYVTHNQYGHYVRSHLSSLRAWVQKEGYPVTLHTGMDRDGKEVEYIKADAVDAWQENGKGKVQLSDGKIVESDVVVLATGNVEPHYLYDVNGDSLHGKKGYYNLDDVGLNKNNVNETDTIAFIGMANGAHFAALSAVENGYKGKFIFISDDGTTPELLDATPRRAYTRKILTLDKCKSLQQQTGGVDAEEWWQLFKKEVVLARTQGFDRHAVVDSIVPEFNDIWRLMKEEQRLAWKKSHGTEWKHMRYRMPTILNDDIKKIYNEGRISYEDGLVRNGKKTGVRCDEDGGFWVMLHDRDGGVREVYTPKLINNTGPSGKLADMSPLMRNLQKRGLVDQHPMGGLRVDDDLHVVDAAGKSQNVFYALGPIIAGDFYEGFTMPAIRECSERLGKSVIKDHVLSDAKDFTPTMQRYVNAEGQLSYAQRREEEKQNGIDGGINF